MRIILVNLHGSPSRKTNKSQHKKLIKRTARKNSNVLGKKISHKKMSRTK
jgi:hypothetical protein